MTDDPRSTTAEGAELGKQDVQTCDHDQTSDRTGESSPTTSDSSSPRSWDAYSGPVWSAAEAARRCGVSRTTLTRRLTAGDIPGAVKTSDGWRIPAQGLALAGLAGRTPPDPQPEEPEQDAEHPDAAEVADLRAQLAVERVKREGAEKLAEERGEYIRDLRSALRAIAPPPAENPDGAGDDSGDDGHQDAPTPSSTRETASQDAASAVEEHPTAPAPRRGVLSRLWGALTEG